MTSITITQEVRDLACGTVLQLHDGEKEVMFTPHLGFELWVAKNSDKIIPLGEITVSGTRYYIGFKPQQ